MRKSALWGKGGRSIVAAVVVLGSLASFTGVAAAANDAGYGRVGASSGKLESVLPGAKVLPGVASRPTAAWSSGPSGVTAAWSTLPR